MRIKKTQPMKKHPLFVIHPLVVRQFRPALPLYLLLALNFALLATVFCSSLNAQPSIKPVAGPASSGEKPWALVVHGGAGGMKKGAIPVEKETEYLQKLDKALALGSGILAQGGGSLDAVEAVVRFMEDCPLFNAGKGAVLNIEGSAEMDAAVMDGASGKAGAVGCVRVIKNPVAAARAVMMKTPHVMMVGQGAEGFARGAGLEMVDPAYFITPERLDQWEKGKKKREALPTPGEPGNPEKNTQGTVGAVARDREGNLAAATSTGGMGNKLAGRIGDTPVIGAGTWASNNTCAVSATGHGEFFIRNVVAYDLSALMEYRGLGLEEAADYLILEKLKEQHADGGLIAVDKSGNIAMPFNTNSMFRGFIKSNGSRFTGIYGQ